MSTQTVVTYWCDACLERGQEVEASASHVIAVDEVRVALDFCPPHEAGLIAALRDVALTRGRAVGPTGTARPKGRRRRGDLTMVLCPDCGRPCAGPVGLSAHRRGTHQMMG